MRGPGISPRLLRTWPPATFVWKWKKNRTKRNSLKSLILGLLVVFTRQLENLGGVNMRKLPPAWVSYQDDFVILYHVYMLTGPFRILLVEGTIHVDKIHMWIKIANITHALPVPVYQQTDFTPKRVIVSCLHETRFLTGVKFSPQYKNRRWGDSSWHDILWWYHVNKYRAMRGNRSGGGGTAIYGLYRYVRLWRVWFSSSLL